MSCAGCQILRTHLEFLLFQGLDYCFRLPRSRRDTLSLVPLPRQKDLPCCESCPLEPKWDGLPIHLSPLLVMVRPTEGTSGDVGLPNDVGRRHQSPVHARPPLERRVLPQRSNQRHSPKSQEIRLVDNVAASRLLSRLCQYCKAMLGSSNF
jgi:hypothetical protein